MVPTKNTWGCLVVRDNWRLIYIYPDPAAVPGEYFGMSQAFPSVVESIASYGGIVCPNAHKLCKLNGQSCRRIGKPCRRDDSSMSRRNLPQADAAHDSCHCPCHCHSQLRLPQLCGYKFRNTQTNANKQINTQLFRISLHECTFSAQPRVSPPSFSFDSNWRCVKLRMIGNIKEFQQ